MIITYGMYLIQRVLSDFVCPVICSADSNLWQTLKLQVYVTRGKAAIVARLLLHERCVAAVQTTSSATDLRRPA
jgi:hypothetical protein